MQEVRKAELEGVELTKEMLREIVSQKNAKAERPENRSFYAYYNDYISKRTNTGKIAESTLKGYETTLKSLREFRAEIRIKDVSAKLLSAFDKFLVKRGEESGKGEVKGSRYNRIKHVRAVIKYIEAQNISIKNPYRMGDLALPEDVINDVFLEKEELERMYKLLKNYEENSTEYRVLIMYLFACSSGLR
ncbi:MAG: phage integrase SAM-like domain-containing protein, partial [Bacteroidales bacterium]